MDAQPCPNPHPGAPSSSAPAWGTLCTNGRVDADLLPLSLNGKNPDLVDSVSCQSSSDEESSPKAESQLDCRRRPTPSVLFNIFGELQVAVRG